MLVAFFGGADRHLAHADIGHVWQGS
jgi:hypothetical protein